MFSLLETVMRKQNDSLLFDSWLRLFKINLNSLKRKRSPPRKHWKTIAPILYYTRLELKECKPFSPPTDF